MMSKEALDGLFDEKRVKILKFFVNNTDDKFYLREVSRVTKVPPATTYRILNSLVETKVLKVNHFKKTKFYNLADSPRADALKELFEEKKSAIQEFVDFCAKTDNVTRVILHGEESKDKTNVLLIGTKIDSAMIKKKVGDIKDKYGISIIELTLEPEQFEQMSVMGLFPGKKTQLWPISRA